jgi:polar amino acid transport system substrate-binding protein
MPRHYSLLLFCLLLLTYLPPCSSAEPLRLVSTDYPPYFAEYLPQQGPVSEIVRQSFALHGTEITIDFMPFARAFREIQQGKFHGLIGAWHNEERARYFLFSLPLYQNEIVFFKQKSQVIQFQNYPDLQQQGLRLALVQGYLQPAGLLDVKLDSHTVTNDEQAFQMLVRGRVDLVPTDRLNGLYLINHRMPSHAEQVEWITPTLEVRPMFLLLAKQHPAAEQLLQLFNAGLVTLQQSGRYQQILDNLLPQDQQP